MSGKSVAYVVKAFYLFCIVFTLTILFGSLVVLLFFFYKYPGLVFPAWLVGGLAICIWYYSFAQKKWRIWAYNNVADMHELAACESSLSQLSLDDYDQTRPVTPGSYAYNANLIKEQLSKPYVFTDDPDVPSATTLAPQQQKNIFRLLVYIAVVALSVWLLLITLNGLFIFLAFLAAYLAMNQAGYFLKRTQQLTLSNEGIETATSGLTNWGDIHDESVNFVGGRSGFYFLTYKYPGGEEKILVNILPADKYEVKHLLYIYRQRYIVNQP